MAKTKAGTKGYNPRKSALVDNRKGGETGLAVRDAAKIAHFPQLFTAQSYPFVRRGK